MIKRFFLSERNIMVAILINAAIIFIMYFPQCRDLSWLEAADHLLVVFFIVEAIVKLKTLGSKAYFASAWNRFDFFIIIGSLPTLLVSLIPNIPDTSLLIVLRLFRLIRLIRFIRFVPHLNQVMTGLTRALKASVFVVLALVFLNFLLAIFTCHFYAEMAPEYFGNPLVSAYSIFQLFTLEGWNEIVATVTSRTENDAMIGFTRLYFVIIILLGGIFGLSLANAVFVDEMTMDNNQDLEQRINGLHTEIRELKRLIEQSVSSDK
ncbi:MAG: ion transporter [Saprospiraceae bacterium]